MNLAEPRYSMSYDEFLEHVEASGGEVTREGDVSTLVGDFCGKLCYLGRYFHSSAEAELYCI